MEWNLDKLGKTLSRAGQEVSVKVKETAEMVQLKQKKASAEAEEESLFAKIGRQFYETHREEAGEDLAELIAGVDAVKEKIAAAQDEINKIRGTKTCPECGAELAYSALFCSRCGASVPVPVQEEPEDDDSAPEELVAEVVAEADLEVEIPEAEEVAEQAEETAEQAEEAVEQVEEAAPEKAEAFAEELKEKAENLAEEAKEKAEAFAGEAKEKAEAFAGEAKEKAGEAAEKAEELAGAAKEDAEKAAEQVAEKAEKVLDSAQDLAKEAWIKAGSFISGIKDSFKSED